MKLKKTGKYLHQIGQTGLSILHCDIRSLCTNLTLLYDILDTFNKFPTFIAISEITIAIIIFHYQDIDLLVPIRQQMQG